VPTPSSACASARELYARHAQPSAEARVSYAAPPALQPPPPLLLSSPPEWTAMQGYALSICSPQHAPHHSREGDRERGRESYADAGHGDLSVICSIPDHSDLGFPPGKGWSDHHGAIATQHALPFPLDTWCHIHTTQRAPPRPAPSSNLPVPTWQQGRHGSRPGRRPTPYCHSNHSCHSNHHGQLESAELPRKGGSRV
jgi:hypothetical protein